MQRYLLFMGSNYYPSGGWEDFVGSFPSVEGALVYALEGHGHSRDWFQVVDLISGEIVRQGKEDYS